MTIARGGGCLSGECLGVADFRGGEFMGLLGVDVERTDGAVIDGERHGKGAAHPDGECPGPIVAPAGVGGDVGHVHDLSAEHAVHAGAVAAVVLNFIGTAGQDAAGGDR